jgi:hypothetical protein
MYINLIDKKYSEEELEENIIFFNGIHWHIVSIYQTLSEEFIEKHSDKVSWDKISQYQKLSEKFIKKHMDKIDIETLMINKKISKKVKNKIEKEINLLKEII